MAKHTIITPCYNDWKSLNKLISELNKIKKNIYGTLDIFIINDHSNEVHEVTGRISGVVNSFHKFSFKKMPNDYNLLATADDGCIEAIEHKSLPWEGWMWHPERYKKFRKLDIDRIKYIFS